MNGPKNLILGFCAPRKFDHLAPFVASLRHVGFAGDVCLLIEHTAADTVDLLRAHGILVERSASSGPPRMSSTASRYFGFLDYLTRFADRYGRVMLVDPMAVVFQSDPFTAALPAGLVFTAERRRIGDVEPLRDAMVQAYGEGVAENLRDCQVANSAVTTATASGMLRYLAAMTRELAGRTTPITGIVDQAVHNFVASMHPLRDAWLDPDDSIAVALPSVPDEAVECSAQGVLIGGSTVPVLSQWEDSAKVREHVKSAPRYRLQPTMQGAWQPGEATSPPVSADAGQDAVVAFYLRQRDAAWLPLFLGSLRCVADKLAIHCVGDFDQRELATLAQHGCTVHHVPAIEPDIAENIAHFYLSQTLQRIGSAETGQLDQVLVLDSTRAMFPRDPFAAKTIGLSMFAEGPTRVADSPYNRDRLAFFVPPQESALQLPVVSSSIMRGRLPLVREFYRQLFNELVGRTDLLSIQKVVQGAVNKLCRQRDLGFPVIVHPNGAEAYFDFWQSGLAIDTRHGVRVGGTVPSVVLGGHTETPLMLKLRIDLNLSDS